MPKLIINDKSNIRQNISMNFFLDDEIITFKGIKKEIEYVDYGEHTIKASTLFVKSSEQKINIEKEVMEIEIRFNWKNWLFALIFWLSISSIVFLFSTIVPVESSNDERKCIFMSYFAAISTDLGCRTFAPEAASSSISW